MKARIRSTMMSLVAALVFGAIQGCGTSGSAQLIGEARSLAGDLGIEGRIRWGEPAPLPPGAVPVGATIVAGVPITIFEAPDGQLWICTPSQNPYSAILGGTPPIGEGQGPEDLPAPPRQGGPGAPQNPAPPEDLTRLFTLGEVPLGSGEFFADEESNTASISFHLPFWAVLKDPSGRPLAVETTSEPEGLGLRVTFQGTVNGVLGALAYNGITRVTFDDPDAGLVEFHYDQDWNAVFTTFDGKPVSGEYSPIRVLFDEEVGG